MKIDCHVQTLIIQYKKVANFVHLEPTEVRVYRKEDNS